MNIKHDNLTPYNTEIKERFLSRYPVRTYNTYKRILVISSQMEMEYNKDLYDFNIAEIKNLLHFLNASTPASCRTNGRIVKTYLQFAIEEGLRKTSNELKKYSPYWYEQFCKEQNLYISERELRSLEEFCVNYNDAVIFRLLWEGVQGKECAEICNLTKNDIDEENNTLHLTDFDGSERDLVVSDRCIALINGALRETQYKKRNGESENPNGNLKDYVDLVQNDYVVRNTITRTINYKAVKKNTIYRRIDVIRKQYGNYNYLTTINIARSGMIKMAKNLFDQYGILGRVQLQMVADRYQIQLLNSIYDFINLDTINKLYKIKL